MRICLIFSFLLFCTQNILAQYRCVDSFNTKNGLPNNFIYQTITDQYGFLWIAGEKGAIRYDGSSFELFDMKNGLPDIEVKKLLLDNEGTLWLLTVNGSLVYWDNTKQEFVLNTEISKFQPFQNIYANKSGGLRVEASNGVGIIKKKKLIFYPFQEAPKNSILVYVDAQEMEHYYRFDTLQNIIYYFTLYKGILESSDTINSKFKIKHIRLYYGDLYLFDQDRKEFTRYTNNGRGWSRQIQNHKTRNAPYYNQSFSGSYVLLHHRINNIVHIDVYDTSKLQFLFSIQSNISAFDLYNDKKNSIWVSSAQGLYQYKSQLEITNLISGKNSKRVYYSIAKKSTQEFLMGNEDGEIIQISPKKTSIIKVPTSSQTEWQRQIVVWRNNFFTFSDGGVFKNGLKEIKFGSKHLNSKCATLFNDSTILFGNDKSIFLLNPKNEKIIEFSNTIPARSICKINEFEFMVATLGGLHKYNIQNRNAGTKICDQLFSKYRPTSLCKTPEGFLFVGTGGNGIYVLFADKPIAHIGANYNVKSEQIKSLCNGRKQEVIAGTFEGVSRINYSISIHGSQFLVQNISKRNGFASEIVHEVLYDEGYIYAATDEGALMITDSIREPNIPISITNVFINNVQHPIQNEYHLNPLQQNVSIRFTGVHLNHLYDHAQYSNDEGATWNSIKSNEFQVQWPSGTHLLWFRAVDVNNHISNPIIKLVFHIDTPFYKTWWFISIGVLLLIVSLLTLNTIFTKRKHQRHIKELLNQQALDELEIQSLKAQMNPHFVFNCLNSIKGFIFDEDFEKADEYLDKFASLLRNTLDFSTKPSISLQAELEYIENYLSLEQLRFGNKFSYQIHVEPSMNQELLAIPSMLLQPYIENAIKHGVCNLEDGIGLIKVNAYQESNKLQIDIDDNGVGRLVAEELKSSKSHRHQSKGTQVTQRRTELYHIQLSIHDKKNNEGKSMGTLVHLEIPIPLH
jgi:sensor histidine kinase YesM